MKWSSQGIEKQPETLMNTRFSFGISEKYQQKYQQKEKCPLGWLGRRRVRGRALQSDFPQWGGHGCKRRVGICVAPNSRVPRAACRYRHIAGRATSAHYKKRGEKSGIGNENNSLGGLKNSGFARLRPVRIQKAPGVPFAHGRQARPD